MRRIMIVDDETDVCELIANVLKKTGEYEIMTINDPQKVEIACEVFHPDMILLDIVMPHMRGTEIIKILSQKPMSANTIIIVTSGLGEIIYDKGQERWRFRSCLTTATSPEEVLQGRDPERAAQAYRVDDYLAKPFSPEKLKAVITENFARGKRR